MSFTFNDAIPAAPNNPSADQPDMLQNNISTNAILDVDHITFNTANGGKHKYVRIPTPVAPVVTGTQEWEVYTGNSAFDVGMIDMFFARPNNAGNDTLLRTTAISNSANGYTQLFGGLIIQWGTSTKTSGGSTSFPIAFPAQCYGVTTTVFENNNNRHFVFVRTISSASFTVASRDSGGNDESNTFFWIAIGK